MSVAAELLALSGGDPFVSVLERSEAHQRDHGCGLHTAGGPVMRLVSAIAVAAKARRVLDLGCGLGYSTLWLARAAGESGQLIGVDDDPDHIEEARTIGAEMELGDRIRYIDGRASEVLPTLDGPFDLVHDDAWFARQPDHLEAALGLLRPGGVFTMANWFLLVDALSGESRNDWERFAGPAWAADTIAYARSLASRFDVDVTWITTPPVGFATKLADLEVP